MWRVCGESVSQGSADAAGGGGEGLEGLVRSHVECVS